MEEEEIKELTDRELQEQILKQLQYLTDFVYGIDRKAEEIRSNTSDIASELEQLSRKAK